MGPTNWIQLNRRRKPTSSSQCCCLIVVVVVVFCFVWLCLQSTRVNCVISYNEFNCAARSFGLAPESQNSSRARGKQCECLVRVLLCPFIDNAHNDNNNNKPIAVDSQLFIIISISQPINSNREAATYVCIGAERRANKLWPDSFSCACVCAQ